MRGKGRHRAASAEAQVDILGPATRSRSASPGVITPRVSSGETGAAPPSRSVARRRRVRVALHGERLLAARRRTLKVLEGQFGAVNRVVGAWDVYRRYPFTICGGVLLAAAPFLSKGN